MAIIVPINEAEAIFAPLFDNKIIQLNEFQLIEQERQDGTFEKAFDFYNIKSCAQRTIRTSVGQ